MSVGKGSTESVVIDHFWAHRHGRDIVFHARHDPGYRCDPTLDRGRACGHALPRFVAEKIGRPCRRCYPKDGS